jgi:hypothetical protein
MNAARDVLVCCVAMLCLGLLIGCGKSVDEEQPVSEVRVQADKMSTDDLRATALRYKEAIVAKQSEVNKLAAKLKELPVAEALGKEAQGLKTDMANLENSVRALTERFQIYLGKLKEKGGDASGLEL